MRSEPFGQTGQSKRKQLLNPGAIQRRIRRPRRPPVIPQKTRLKAGIKLRPAGGEQLAELPAGEPFAAGKMIKTRLVLG